MKKNKLVAVRVIDIILDLNHPKAESLGGYDSIGTIFYSVIEKNTATENKNFANYAKPLFTHLKYYPLINEVVLILTTSDKDVYKNSLSLSTYYLPQVNMWVIPTITLYLLYKTCRGMKTLKMIIKKLKTD